MENAVYTGVMRNSVWEQDSFREPMKPAPTFAEEAEVPEIIKDGGKAETLQNSDILRRDAVQMRRDAVHIAQRVLDIVFTSVLLLILAPFFLFLALIVRLDSPGPVLFIQKRVGKNGKEFSVFKFRSMVADAEARKRLLEAANERSGPVFKMKNDPRITRAGRLLRKLSLDELPQLLNVLRGEMSLVGPRPALPSEVALYTPRQSQRLAVTPGLTGLCQVSGRANISFEHSVELDLHYIQQQSVGQYFRILLLTVPAVITGDGAC